MAKPKQIFTEREKAMLLALYELGKTDQQIADCLGLKTVPTLRKMLEYNTYTVKETNEKIPLSSAIKKGIANDRVEMSLYGKAISGNVTAQIFWLCNREPRRWVNVQRIENTGKYIIH